MDCRFADCFIGRWYDFIKKCLACGLTFRGQAEGIRQKSHPTEVDNYLELGLMLRVSIVLIAGLLRLHLACHATPLQNLWCRRLPLFQNPINLVRNYISSLPAIMSHH